MKWETMLGYFHSIVGLGLSTASPAHRRVRKYSISGERSGKNVCLCFGHPTLYLQWIFIWQEEEGVHLIQTEKVLCGNSMSRNSITTLSAICIVLASYNPDYICQCLTQCFSEQVWAQSVLLLMKSCRYDPLSFLPAGISLPLHPSTPSCSLPSRQMFCLFLKRSQWVQALQTLSVTCSIAGLFLRREKSSCYLILLFQLKALSPLVWPSGDSDNSWSLAY